MSQIDFESNQLVVAMDHARYFGRVPGLEDPGRTIETLTEAGADAIMTSYGVVKHYREQLIGKIPTLMRLDGGASVYRDEWLRAREWRLLHDVEEALDLGVDGVCLMLFMGSDVELDTMEIVAQVAADCRTDGLPVMVEALPCPHESVRDPLDAGCMADAARLAFEHGADVVKTYYTGDAESFAEVSANCPAPVLIAGGARMDSERAALEVVHGAMAGGGRGIVFGRNIWQSKDPVAMLRALRAVIHDGADVDTASGHLG